MNNELKEQVELGVTSMLRVDSEKDYQKNLIEDISDVFGMSKKQAGELIKAAYDKTKYAADIEAKKATLDQIEQLGF